MLEALNDNWFSNPDDLRDTTPEELKGIGIPLKFAKELITAVQQGPPAQADGKSSSGKGNASDRSGAPIGRPEHSRDVGKGRAGKTDVRDAWADGGGKGGKSKGKSSKSSRSTRRLRDDGMYEEVIHVEEFEPMFKAKMKIIGNAGSNMKHIKDETKTAVHVQQEGASGPLTIHLTSENESNLTAGVNLLKDLLKSVRQDYKEWRIAEGAHLPADEGYRERDHGHSDKGKGKSASKGVGKKGEAKGDRKGPPDEAFAEEIEFEATDAEYDIKGHIIGEGARNVHHIRDESGATLWVFQERKGDPLSVRVSAPTEDAKTRGAELARDLVEAIRDEYYTWVDDGKPDLANVNMSKGKGKGKSKKGKSDDYRPNKRPRI